MPVVAIPIEDLNRRLGTQLSPEEMEMRLEQLGCDIEGFTQIRRIQCNNCGSLQELTLQEELPVSCPECQAHQDDNPSLWEALGQEDVVRMDLLPVRPDIFDQGGLSRALRGLLDLETGLPQYKIGPAQWSVHIDDSVHAEDPYRPHIECAIIRNLKLDDLGLRLLMKLQENLHWALGRNRKLASIGVYDLSSIQQPVRYTTFEREGIRFVPLHAEKDDEQTPQQILETHPKGVAYARLLEGYKRVPILIDSNDRVLSMPPIINSHATRVHTGTTDVFIDVTGITDKAVNKALHTLVTSMLELYPGSQAEQVTLEFSDRKTETPELKTETFTFHVAAATRLIGIELNDESASKLLRQMRHDVAPGYQAGILNVTAASYRNDLMHEVDLMEDLAIAYGYQNIVRSLVPTMTVAKERPERVLANRAGRVLTGLGYFEVMSLLLSNEDEQFGLLGIEDKNEAVLLDHPASTEQTLLRVNLMPQLLKLFAINRGQGLPQKLFEIDDVVRVVEGKEQPEEQLHLVAGILDTEVGFADLKALSESISHELGMNLTYKAIQHPGMLPGRAAQLEYKGQAIGVMGEIHPAVLEKLRLSQPVVALELDLTPLVGPLNPHHEL